MYNTQHPCYCGIDRHARAMDVGILPQAGETLLHQNMTTPPEAVRNVIAPYRPARVVAVAGLFPWDWLADLCADAARPCVLGHALARQALHGGKATHDPRDAHQIAGLRRGGRLPPAYVSPAARRATRALLRRRMPLAHNRGALLAPVPNPTSPSPLPAIGTNIAATANRDGVAERWAAPAGHNSLAGALARVSASEAWLRAVARPIVPTAQPPDAHPRYRRPTVPGLGPMLRRVRLDASPHRDRGPRGQEVAASCRRVTGAQEANGPRAGPAGAPRGQTHLPWAFAAAAVWGRRDHPAGQPGRASGAHKHDQGQAWPLFAHQGARAVSDRCKRQGALARPRGLTDAGRGGGARAVSLDNHGLPLLRATLSQASMTAALHASERLGPSPCAIRLLRHLLRLLLLRREWSRVHGCCSSPEPAPHWTTVPR